MSLPLGKIRKRFLVSLIDSLLVFIGETTEIPKATLIFFTHFRTR